MIESYINYLKKNNYAQNTIITYQNILNKYQDILNDIRIVKKKIISYTKNPNTAWIHYNVLCSYFKFSKDKRIKNLHELKLPPIQQKYNVVFTKEFLIKKTSDLSNYKNIVIRFLFETGLRAIELQNIIKINQDTIVLKGKGNKIREIFHNYQTTKYFKGFDFTTKTLRLWVKEVLGEEFTPHSIRRSHATHMLLKGANPKAVMLQLGHSKIETTFRYLNLSKKMNKEIYDKYF